MPTSKHRRKPNGKAVAHPGRGKPGKPLRPSWLAEETSTVGLPLFDWVEAKDGPEMATAGDRPTQKNVG
jgi:hypothetical protein